MNIELSPIESKPDNLSTITGKYQLPCGCTLQHTCLNTGVLGTAEAMANFTDMAQKRLAYWFEKRAPRHVCKLVSGNNPNGLTPRPN